MASMEAAVRSFSDKKPLTRAAYLLILKILE